MTASQVKTDLYMHMLSFNRQLFNPTIIKHNHFDAHIATAKNCGTHWIKYMLGHILAELYNVPPPGHIRDDSIIGHPKTPPKYPNIPRIALTHSHPHYAMHSDFLRKKIKIPKCVFVVRHPRDLLVSHYEKSKGAPIDKKYGRTGVTFTEYLRCDISKRYRLEDIWGIIRFFNAWGAAQEKAPELITMIKYEDLLADTQTQLQHMCDFIGMASIQEPLLKNAIAKSSREEMAANRDTRKDQDEKIVNLESRDADDWFSPEDQKFFEDACARYLRFDFGYLNQA